MRMQSRLLVGSILATYFHPRLVVPGLPPRRVRYPAAIPTMCEGDEGSLSVPDKAVNNSLTIDVRNVAGNPFRRIIRSSSHNSPGPAESSPGCRGGPAKDCHAEDLRLR